MLSAGIRIASHLMSLFSPFCCCSAFSFINEMWPYIMVINLWRTFNPFKWKDTCGCKRLFLISPQESGAQNPPWIISPSRFHVSSEGLFPPVSFLASFILFFWCCSLFWAVKVFFPPSGYKRCLCCAFSPTPSLVCQSRNRRCCFPYIFQMSTLANITTHYVWTLQ